MGAAPAWLADEWDGDAGEQPEHRWPHLEAVQAGAPSEESPRVPQVLLVEDDPSMRFLCQVNLENAGFSVVSVETGSQALEAAARERPDLVLLDVMLPDLGGFEVAERLTEVPIVFLSARAASEDLERGRLLGAIDYITKPFDPISLAGRLKEDLEMLREGGAAEVWRLRFGAHSGD